MSIKLIASVAIQFLMLLTSFYISTERPSEKENHCLSSRPYIFGCWTSTCDLGEQDSLVIEFEEEWAQEGRREEQREERPFRKNRGKATAQEAWNLKPWLQVERPLRRHPGCRGMSAKVLGGSRAGLVMQTLSQKEACLRQTESLCTPSDTLRGSMLIIYRSGSSTPKCWDNRPA